MQTSRRRITVLAAITAAATLLLAPAATAAPPTSAIEVSDSTLAPGQTFTITQTLYNPADLTILGSKAALYTKETPIVGLIDLVGCPGAPACDAYLSSYRGGAGDIAPGQGRTVNFTFRVKDDAPSGTYTLQHQFAGENYAFEVLDGPQITITRSATADIKVSLTATPRWGLSAEVEYVATATNAGPGAATGITLAGNYPGRRLVSASGCTAGPSSTVSCTIPNLASGASTSVRFTTAGSMFSFGSFVTTVARKASTPADPNSANDTASRTCKAFTGMLVTC